MLKFQRANLSVMRGGWVPAGDGWGEVGGGVGGEVEGEIGGAVGGEVGDGISSVGAGVRSSQNTRRTTSTAKGTKIK